MQFNQQTEISVLDCWRISSHCTSTSLGFSDFYFSLMNFVCRNSVSFITLDTLNCCYDICVSLLKSVWVDHVWSMLAEQLYKLRATSNYDLLLLFENERGLVWQLHYITFQRNYVLNTNDNVLARTGNIPVLPWHCFRGPWRLYTYKRDESRTVVSFFICPSWYIYAHVTVWWGTLVNICVEEGNRIRTCALT